MAEPQPNDAPEEEQEGEGSPSLCDAFPDIEEDLLQGLFPWPPPAESLGGFYSDLLAPAPALFSADPLVRMKAELRSRFAHHAVLRCSGAFSQTGIAKETIVNTIATLARLYRHYSASLIQRWWRANRRQATADDKAKFRAARGGNPARAGSDDERGLRKSFLDELLHAAEPLFR
jgi:hypothetical protein